MSVKFAFLDTTVFLHYKPLKDIDWPTLLDADSVQILITSVVTSQLDKHKDQNPKSRFRKRAKLALKGLWKLLGEAPSVGTMLKADLRSGVTVSYIGRSPQIDYSAHSLDREWDDDRLLASIIDFKSENPDRKVILITSDMSLRLRASSYEIETLPPSVDDKLEEELDPIEKEKLTLERQLQQLEHRVPKLKFGFEDFTDHRRYTLEEPLELADQIVEEYFAEERKKYPKIAFPKRERKTSNKPFRLKDVREGKVTIIGPSDEELIEIQGKKVSVSEERVSQYNAKLDAFYEKSRECFIEATKYENLRRRLIKLNFQILNEGACPAEDVEITLTLPLQFHLSDKYDLQDQLGEPPVKPKIPKPPTQAIQALRRFPRFADVYKPSWLSLNFPTVDLSSISPGRSTFDPSRPSIEKVGDSYQVVFPVGKLKHKQPPILGPLCVLFFSFDEASSFTLEYQVHADNLPEPLSEKLHVAVEKGVNLVG